MCKQICWLLKVNVVIPATKRLQGFSVRGNLWVKRVLFATRWQPFIFSTEGSVKKCRREFYQLYSLLWKVHYRDHVVPCVNNRFHFIERKWISILRHWLTDLAAMHGGCVFQYSLRINFTPVLCTYIVLTKCYIGASWFLMIFNPLNISVNLFFKCIVHLVNVSQRKTFPSDAWQFLKIK